MKKIAISGNRGKGMFVLVDDEDFDYLSQFSWCLLPDVTTNYARRGSYTGKRTITIVMHREVMKVKKGEIVDHVNGNGLDNRKANLRICTPAENAKHAQKRRDNHSGYKGVYWHKQSKRWRACINVDHKALHLGSFKDKKLAAQVYDEAAKKYFEEYAVTNFIN